MTRVCYKHKEIGVKNQSQVSGSGKQVNDGVIAEKGAGRSPWRSGSERLQCWKRSLGFKGPVRCANGVASLYPSLELR